MSLHKKLYKLLISKDLVVGLSLLAMASLWSVAARAADIALGGLTVFTVSGEHLQAEVDINNVPNDVLAQLKVNLADEALARAAGIDWTGSLPYLYAEVQSKPTGQPFVKLMSSRAIAENSLHLLIELSWNEGSYLREYKVPLEPVVAATSPSSQQLQSKPQSKSVPAANVQLAGSASLWPAVMKVRQGDSLMELARRLPLGGTTLEQATWSIYKANPKAFSGSVDQLIAGTRLQIPSLSQMQAIGFQQASRGLRQSQSGNSAPVAKNSLPKISKQAGIAFSSEETTLRDSSLAMYQPASASPLSEQQIADQLQAMRQQEQLITQNRMIESQQLSLKVDESLTEVKQLVQGVSGSVAALNKTVELNSRGLLNLSENVAQLQDTSLQPQATGNALKEQVANNEMPLTSAVLPAASSNNTNTWGLSSQYLRSLVLIALALALSSWLVMRQLKSYRSAALLEKDKEAQLAERKAKHSVEVIDSPSPTDWFRRHLRSARVSEADLVKALHRYPNRQDLRIRLMERYANNKDVEGFAQQGRDMFQITRGLNEEWPRVIQMGLALELEMGELESSTATLVNSDEYGLERDIGLDQVAGTHARSTLGRQAPAYVRQHEDIDMELDATAVISRAAARQAARR